MTPKAILIAGATLLALTAGAAQAQDFYVGAAFEAGSGTFTDSPETSDNDHTSLQAIAGARFDVGGIGFVGGEFETSLGGEASNDYAGYESLSGLQRLRFVAGTQVGQTRVFATFGQSMIDYSDGAGDDSYEGTSLGIGGEFPVSDKISIRAEAIHDRIEADDLGFELETTSIRAGAVINF